MSRDDTEEPDAALQTGMAAGTGRPKAAGNDTARRSRLLAQESRRAWSRSRELQVQTLEVAARFAATEDQVAATLTQLAVSDPRHLPDLRRLSEAAASQAIRMRQWAHDQAAAG